MGQGLRKKLEAKREEYENFVREEFRKGFSVLCDVYPEVAKVSWKQYTPYWNDGDECLFRTGARDADIFDEQGDELGYWMDDKPKERMDQLCKDVQEFLDEFSSQDYEIMFGDHVYVTVTRCGVEIEEYIDHE